MEELDIIYHLATIRDAYPLQEEINKIETFAPKYAPFVATLCQLEDDLQMGAVLKFIKPFIES